MRKFVILTLTILSLLGTKAYADGKFACQLNGQDQENAPCLVGNIKSIAGPFTSDPNEFNDCNDISKIISKIESSDDKVDHCRLDADGERKVYSILFKTIGFLSKEKDADGKDKKLSSFFTFIGGECASQDFTDGAKAANCMNSEVSGKNDGETTITSTSAITKEVIIAGYNIMTLTEELCLGDKGCNKSFDKTDAVMLVNNDVIARDNPKNWITVFPGASDKCAEDTPCGSYSTLVIDIPNGGPAFDVHTNGTLRLRNLKIVIKNGYLAKVSGKYDEQTEKGSGGAVFLSNVVIDIENDDVPPVIQTTERGTALFSERITQNWPYGTIFTGKLPKDGLVQIDNVNTTGFMYLYYDDGKSNSSYKETDNNKKWVKPSDETTTFTGSFFIRPTFNAGISVFALGKKSTCPFNDFSKCELKENDKCIIISNSDDKTTSMSVVTVSSLKNEYKDKLVSSQIACGDSNITFKCEDGKVLVSDSTGNLSCEELNGWIYSPTSHKKECAGAAEYPNAVELKDGSCLKYGCPYGSTYNSDPDHMSCDCDASTTIRLEGMDPPVAIPNAFICIKTCGENKINGITKYLKETYDGLAEDVKQAGKSAFIELSYSWGQVTECPPDSNGRRDCFMGPAPLASMDQCVPDVPAMINDCNLKPDVKFRVLDETTGSCQCKSDYLEIDGACVEKTECDEVTATLNKATNACVCKDSGQGIPSDDGLSCDCPDNMEFKNGKCKAIPTPKCTSDADCKDGKICNNNVCIALPADKCTDEGQEYDGVLDRCVCQDGYICNKKDDNDCACSAPDPKTVCQNRDGYYDTMSGICIVDPSQSACLQKSWKWDAASKTCTEPDVNRSNAGGGDGCSLNNATTPNVSSFLLYILTLAVVVAKRFSGLPRRSRSSQ